MDAITLHCDDKASAVSAIECGNDLLCCVTYAVQIPAVLEAVKCGNISAERISESVVRLLKLKLAMGIIK